MSNSFLKKCCLHWIGLVEQKLLEMEYVAMLSPAEEEKRATILPYVATEMKGRAGYYFSALPLEKGNGKVFWRAMLATFRYHQEWFQIVKRRNPHGLYHLCSNS